MADRGCGQLDSQRKYTVTTGSYYSVVGRERRGLAARRIGK
jgi:hypothetical protein